MPENKNLESSTSSSPPPQTGLSKEAWVAISTLGAALITALVTLVIHLYPQTSPANSPSAPTPSPVAASSPTPQVVTADAIAGKWSGDATDSTGKSFQVTLEVKKSCGINERCGTMSVSHVPCYAEAFLERTRDREFEFRTDNFYGESDRSQCAAGAGEHFRLRPDGKLDYWTTYDPEARGLLERQTE